MFTSFSAPPDSSGLPASDIQSAAPYSGAIHTTTTVHLESIGGSIVVNISSRTFSSEIYHLGCIMIDYHSTSCISNNVPLDVCDCYSIQICPCSCIHHQGPESHQIVQLYIGVLIIIPLNFTYWPGLSRLSIFHQFENLIRRSYKRDFLEHLSTVSSTDNPFMNGQHL
jgi:hypothetical protein